MVWLQIGLAPDHMRLADGTRILYLIDDSRHAHVYPQSAEAAAFYAEHIAPASFFYLVEKETARLTGYAVPPEVSTRMQMPAPGLASETCQRNSSAKLISAS